MLDPKTYSLRARLLQHLMLLPSGVVTGVFVGALVNTINGQVNPRYFLRIINLEGIWDMEDQAVWLMSIGQGVLTGAILGLVSSFFLMVGIGLISKLRCPLGLSLKVQVMLAASCLLFWFIGGLNGLLLAEIAPRYSYANYDSSDFLPKSTDALRFAWVGSSNHGAHLGLLLSIFGALIWFSARWRQIEKQARA